MPVSRTRLFLLSAVLAAAISLLLSAGASAAITASEITSPADPAQVFEDETAGTGALTVTGNVTGTGEIDLLCYYGSGETAETELIESEIPTSGGKFTETVSLVEFPENPCVLRAVPTGTEPAAAPGSSSPFTGPRVAASLWRIAKDAGTKALDSYSSRNVNLTALLETTSAGDCGLSSTAVFGSADLAPPARLFECDGALFERLPPGERSEIQVDGKNAYDTFAGTKVFDATKPKAGSPPEITATSLFDTATALTTVKETEPLVGCSGAKAAFPETSESCETIGSAGVSLEREWRPAANGLLMYMTDTWRSTDSAPHTVSADYSQTFDAEAPGGLLEVPGRSGFASVKPGEALSLAAGGGVIVYREDPAAPETGDLEHHPFGALVYDLSPGEALHVTEGSSFRTQFYMPYTLTIPASGSRTVRMAYAQSLTLPGARALAAEAFAAFHPSVSISAPTNGSSVSTSTVLVSGKASDALGLGSVSVNGQNATIAAGGAWSATVPLALGANTLTATAVNVSGVSSTASVAVTRIPAPSPPPKPLKNTIRLGAVKVSKGQVTFAVTCKGPTGTTCNVAALLQTVERVSHGRVTAVLAGHSKKRTVTVASYKATIAAGRHTIAVLKLNATGRKLLAKFHKLPARLTVVLIGASGVRATALAQNVTVTPPRRKRHHH